MSEFRLLEQTVCLSQLLSTEDSLYIVNCVYFGQLFLSLGRQSPLSWYRNSLPFIEVIVQFSRINFLSGCDAMEPGTPLILPSLLDDIHKQDAQYFDVFLTVHHSIDLFQITNLMHNSFIL